ncbi:hypothetical protein BUY37_04890 [Staphylococcus cohnii]|uniref:Uncharacterized protein n=1 Tax=Staphylococcus cohnii TaxID=29382 RepID=A0A2T4LT82_9STAP|nr:hypothetical protein BUY34_05540 [Staphylococcus cohnii]RIL76399.1 hypothetical protein BUY37_04890 [Staphylococcus cohnii]RIL81303.1 hypothetical protein BUY39_00860 [Staphylococcus cohnii]
MDWSSLYLKSYDFDCACLPGDMARACSLSLISFPRASARCKISISDVVENNFIYLYVSFVFLVISLINE